MPGPAQPTPTSPTSQGPPPSKKEYEESKIQVYWQYSTCTRNLKVFRQMILTEKPSK